MGERLRGSTGAVRRRDGMNTIEGGTCVTVSQCRLHGAKRSARGQLPAGTDLQSERNGRGKVPSRIVLGSQTAESGKAYGAYIKRATV